MQSFLPVAMKAARQAGKRIATLSLQQESLVIDAKTSNDFVTNADREAEAIIRDVLSYHYPTHQILGEESGLTGPKESSYTWIIDPIDGTTNFMHGIPQYAVSIALKHHGDIICGVVYDVAKNELFSAERGKGAMLDNRRIRVSDNKEMSRALIATGFPFRRTDDFEGYAQTMMKVAQRTAGLRRAGSAALDLAWVACGRFDGYWESGLKAWDCAAGALLVSEAGGLITDLKGGEDWLDSGNICAGNPKIFAQLLPLVGKIL